MPPGEHEIELIERYLDDALDMSEVDALQTRLAHDPQLVATLERIRSERALRKAVYAGYEPDDAAVSRTTQFAANLIRQRPEDHRRTRPLRYVLAAAACMALGFFGRGLLDHSQDASQSGNPIATGPGQVNVEKVSAYKVTLRDETGRVVAVQRFDSVEKAQEFADDLARWQSHSERLASGRFVLTADRF
jgi:anti-sigma factor RsiW